MTEQMPTSEVLNRAADLIEERGWGRGPHSFYGEQGVCVMGALHLAQFDRLPDEKHGNAYMATHLCPAGQAMYGYLVESAFTRSGSAVDESATMWSWNDSRPDVAPVIEALRACAVIEASRERESAEALPPVSA